MFFLMDINFCYLFYSRGKGIKTTSQPTNSIGILKLIWYQKQTHYRWFGFINNRRKNVQSDCAGQNWFLTERRDYHSCEKNEDGEPRNKLP